MSFCKYCGKQLPDNVTVCDVCQAERTQSTPQPVAAPVAASVAAPVQTPATTPAGAPVATPFATVVQQPPKKNWLVAIIPALVGCVVFVCMMFAFFGRSSDGSLFGPSKEEQYIAAAKDIICDNLKNPSSAIFNDAYVLEEDDYGRAIVFIDVTSENALGGAVRDACYVCVQSVDGNGGYECSRYMAYTKADVGYDDIMLGALKKANNFGEPMEDTD